MKTFKIELTEEQVNIVLGGLAELPLKVAKQVDFIIRQDCQNQLEADATKEKPKTTPKKG